MIRCYLASFLMLFIAAPAHAAGLVWMIDHETSQLTFQATQQGGTFEGTIAKFDGIIFFDPADLPASKADITIEPSSIKTQDAERDGEIKGADWFDVARFPAAKFVTKSIVQNADGSFTAHADLTIRDITKPVDLPFTLVFAPDGQSVSMTGAVTLSRLDFGVGQGEWKDTASIGRDVTVKIALRAVKKP